MAEDGVGPREKVRLGIDVLTAARQRISWIFDNVPQICISFSGGKDSTVMFHLVMDEAVRRNRRVGVLFIDWEAQYSLTIEHVKTMFAMYAANIDLYWYAVPLRTTNACSMYEPEWICWQPEKRDLWVREPDLQSITDTTKIPFYTHNMTFEEFVPAFSSWYARGKLTASFVGIRTDESLNRWRTIMAGKKQDLEGRHWTTWTGGHVYNAYPIYDWATQDIWAYHGKFPDKPYNMLYDRMHLAGLSIAQMRICEPYGDEQRKGLWLYHIVEPETWSRIVLRVAGANTGALYARERGSIMGNAQVAKPAHLTWEEYARFLLDTMPPTTAEHYRNKISTWMFWYREKNMNIADELPGDMGSKDMPSWRRVCKVLLKNDYWCMMLCFSPQKTASYEKYRKLMRKRRDMWNLGL